MVILGSQNKITDYLMILAWACHFNHLFIVMVMVAHSVGFPVGPTGTNGGRNN